MRIAIFHNLPSGGAKRTLHEEVRQLYSKHTVDVYTLSSADSEFCDLRPYATSHRIYEFSSSALFESPLGRLNQLVRWADLRRLERLYRRIARDIDQSGCDVLLVHPCRFQGCPSVVRFAELPTLYYCHEPVRRLYEASPWRPYDKPASGWRRAADAMDPFARMYFSLLRETDQRNTRSAGRVLVNSRYVEEAVSRIYGVSASVSYHGVDTDFFRPLDLPRGRFVLSVGSLTPMKAFDFLIESVAAIAPEKRPPLVIASNSVNPPEREYLLRLAEDSAVRIDLLENIDNQRLLQLYNEAGVVAYAPLREPFGLVPLEAMACAAPLVAVREGGIKESVVDRTTGLLVDRNPVSFGNAIRMLLDDPQLAARYGRQGREEVRTNWSWESAMATLQAHLSAALPMTESGPPAVVAARH